MRPQYTKNQVQKPLTFDFYSNLISFDVNLLIEMTKDAYQKINPEI